MGRARECEEWLEELVGDFGFEATHETHVMYYKLIIASKRLATWALAAGGLEPDLEKTAQAIKGAVLGIDPDDEQLQDLWARVFETETLARQRTTH